MRPSSQSAGVDDSVTLDNSTLSSSNEAIRPINKLDLSSSKGSFFHAIKQDRSLTLEHFRRAQWARIIQISTAVLLCLLAAGIVFGYAALKPILIDKNVYRKYCTQKELDQNVRVCVQQEIRLNLMFTIAAVGTNASSLPVGAILDRYGPRVCGLISSIFLTLGLLSLAFGSEVPFDGYLIGYLFLAIGGCFTYMPSIHLSTSFPLHSGLILAMLSGAFDSSSAIFLIYQEFYLSTGKNFGPKKFFLAYLTVPILVVIVQLTYMPKASYKSNRGKENSIQANETDVLESHTNENTALLREENLSQNHLNNSNNDESFNSKLTKQLTNKEENMNRISGVFGVLHGKSIKDQIKSPWFILITIFTIIQMIRINYFVATIFPQYEYILGSYEDAVAVNSLFNRALPIGGLVAIPFVGLVLDNLSTLSVIATLLASTTVIGVLGCLPYKWAAYSNVCLIVLYRPFYYTSLSDFTSKIFGFETFGTVYGLMFCISGIFGFTLNGLDKLRYQVFNRDPVPINIFLIIITMAQGIVLCLFVKLKADAIKRKELEFEAEHASESAMPTMVVAKRC